MLWGWLCTDADAGGPDGSWQGAQSVPRVVEAAPNGRSAVTYPLPELASLRDEGGALATAGLTLRNASSLLLGIDGSMLDIEATITFTAATSGGSALSCGVKVLADPTDPDGEGTIVVVNAAGSSAAGSSVGGRRSLNVEVLSRPSSAAATPLASSLTSSPASFPARRAAAMASADVDDGAADLSGDLTVALRVLVDASIVESFVDGGAAAHTALPVRSGPAARGVYAVSSLVDASTGGACTFSSLTVWPMKPFSYDTSLCAATGCLYP